VPPSQFIVGAAKGGAEDDGADLDDDTQICSCHVSPKVVPAHVDVHRVLLLGSRM
jgi:hypothetical protein